MNTWWIILDSGYTVNLFRNPKMLANIKKVRRGVWLHCNGGNRYMYWYVTLGGYGKVWLFWGGTINIIFLERVSDIHPVTLESGRFTVQRGGGNHVFQEQETGLFILDVHEW